MSGEKKSHRKSIISLIQDSIIWIFFFGGLILLGTAAVMPFKVKEYYETRIENYKTIADLGAVGDFIGGTTVALLTAASVVLLLATIIMQRKEIKISQKSIEELVKQTEASIQQAQDARTETKITNETMKKQQFETTFFNMLSLHHQIVDSIRIKESGEVINDREAIAIIKKDCERMLAREKYISENPEKGVHEWKNNFLIRHEYLNNFSSTPGIVSQELLNVVYEKFHKKYENIIGHYMRNNYRIVKFIVNNVADNEEEKNKIKQETGREPIIGDKRFYFGTLRAQWSNAEFELIFINSLYGKNHKFKKLILEYDVLDILETNQQNELSSSLQKLKLKESMWEFKAYESLIED